MSRLFRTVVYVLLLSGLAGPIQATDSSDITGAAAGVPAQVNTPVPVRNINILADDPLVRQILSRHQQQSTGNGNAVITRPTAASQSRTVPTTAASTTEVIKLEIPEDQPPVVNRSKSFVFRNITQADSSQASTTDSLQQRQQQIERLRRAAASQ